MTYNQPGAFHNECACGRPVQECRPADCKATSPAKERQETKDG